MMIIFNVSISTVFRKCLPIVLLASALSACTSLPSKHGKLELKSSLGRINLERAGYFPSFFKEKFYGRIISVVNESGETVFSDTHYNRSEDATVQIDVPPGEYKIRVQCQSEGAGTHGYNDIWVVTADKLIKEGLVLNLACDLYVSGKGKGGWSSDQRLLSNKQYSVRLTENER